MIVTRTAAKEFTTLAGKPHTVMMRLLDSQTGRDLHRLAKVLADQYAYQREIALLEGAPVRVLNVERKLTAQGSAWRIDLTQ